VGFTGDRPLDNTGRPRAGPNNIPEIDAPAQDFGPIYFDYREHGGDDAEDSRHARKRENQATRWLQKIIPLLVPIYIQLVQQTDSLRTLDDISHDQLLCTCSSEQLSGRGKVKHLNIKVLRWNRKLSYQQFLPHLTSNLSVG
jgi:hypothetical protein